MDGCRFDFKRKVKHRRRYIVDHWQAQGLKNPKIVSALTGSGSTMRLLDTSIRNGTAFIFWTPLALSVTRASADWRVLSSPC
jgi:hypothetical protein